MPVVRTLSASHPDVHLQILEHEPAESLDLLAADDIDLALTYEFDLAPAAFDATLETVPLWEADWGLGVPAGDPGGRGAAAEVLGRYRDSDWIVNSRNNSDLDAVRRVASTAGFVPRVVHRADSLELVEDLIVAGLGVGLLPEAAPARRRGAAAAAARPPCRAARLRRRPPRAHRAGRPWPWCCGRSPTCPAPERHLTDWWAVRFGAGGAGHRQRMSHATEGRVSGEQDHAAEPASPTDLTKHSWGYVLRKTAREFTKDECTDLAAALTYYAVLSLFPAVIALLSLVGLFGQGQATVKTLLDIANAGRRRVDGVLDRGPADRDGQPAPARPGSRSSSDSRPRCGRRPATSGSFGRAMNRIYEIREGRPFWKLRPLMLLVTLVLLLLVAAVALALVLTGPAATAVGNAIGIGSTAVTVWNIAKWPVILLVVVFVVALLYWATPNVKQPKFRWISVGAVLAIVVWIVASALFGVYVVTFSSYNKTYGALAGVVVFLLWLWITNLALLFGAELDSELERARELQAGLPAEETVQLPPRDTRNIEKLDEKQQKDVERGRELRESRGELDGE